MKEDFNLLNIQEYEQFIDSWKRPKKQKWGIGDIFSIKLPSGTYFFGQIVELNEGVAPICLIFDLNSKHMPSTQEIYDAEIITAVWINSYYFDDYTFNVLFRMEIIGEVGSTNRRDPVRNVTWSTSSLEEFCMNYQLEWKSEVIENMLYNRHFVRRRKCMIE
nr:Imm26 family immunity protein [Priestia taiwanensis]